jgi:hypothetical protein
VNVMLSRVIRPRAELLTSRTQVWTVIYPSSSRWYGHMCLCYIVLYFSECCHCVKIAHFGFGGRRVDPEVLQLAPFDQASAFLSAVKFSDFIL